MDRSLIGTHLGQYVVESELGRGGMGAVYRGTQPALSRTVAIKVLATHLASDEQFISRFRREAVLIANVKHPHIVTVFDFGQQDGILYLVMEYVRGATLKERVPGPMDPMLAAELVRQIADALDYAHTQGVIHRDIKPANIMLERPDFAKLADFGIARLTDDREQLTAVGQGIGTPEYMSPEQGEGLRNIDGRSDIYSLGIVLFQLLTGEVPFSSTSLFDIIRQHMEKPLPAEKMITLGVPFPIVQAVTKATAKSPNDRFQSAGQFRDALANAMRMIASSPAQTVVPQSDVPTQLDQKPGAGLANMLEKQQPTPPNNPTYGAPPPQYGTFAGAPPPAPIAPPPYGAPLSQGGTPPQYGGTPPSYGTPGPQYGAPPPQFGPPQPTYGAATPPTGAPTEVRPPQKKSGSKAILIFGALFLFLCLGCSGLTVFLGGLGVLGSLGGATEPPDLAEKYMVAIRDAKWSDAENLCLPDLMTDINSQGNGMQAFITSNDVRPVSWSFDDRTVNGDEAIVSGPVTFTRNRPGRVDLTFLKDGGSWKIDSISLYEDD